MSLRFGRLTFTCALVTLAACSSNSDKPAGPTATPANAVAASVTQADGFVGLAAPYVPAIKVTDADGQPIANVLITAEVQFQSGSISVIDPVTDGFGVASVGTWTLGTRKGAQTLTLRAPGLPAVTFTANARGYDIVIRYVGAPPSAQVQAGVDAAKGIIEQIILSELAEHPLVNFSANACAPGAGVLNETVDDIVVLVQFAAIDGAFGVNAEAAPCAFRLTAPFSPALGVVRFDEGDVARTLADGSFQFIFAHEMLHAIGFGSAWNVNALLTGGGTANPLFVGAKARAAYVAAGGTAPTGVPVANTGGVGTRDAHWRESEFTNELMTTTYQHGATNPLSAITIGSLEDLGYRVSYATAQGFTLVVAGVGGGR